MRHKLRGLPHVEVGDGVSEAAFKADDWLEKRWPDAEQCDESGPYISRAKHMRIPLDRVVVEHQRCMAEGFRTTSKDEIHRAFANISISRIDRLLARSTIDLHGERCHRLAHAKTQRSDACWVHFVGGNVDAAKNDMIEGIGCEWLTQQQRTAALHS